MSNEKMQFQLGRPVEIVADEINEIKEQTRKIIIHAASEIGRRLIEAKEQVPHGEWGEWLKINVDYSQSTANNFMKIHREFDLNSQAFKNLTYTKAVALFSINQDERAAFAEEVKAEDISVRELEKLVKEKQQLEAEKAAVEEQLKKAQRENSENLEQMNLQLTELEEQLAETEKDDAHKKRLEQELAVASSTIEQLQSDLKAKPLDVPAVVEAIPPEIQKELDELRATKSNQEAQQDIDPALVKFRVQFDVLVKSFDGAFLVIKEIADKDDRAKYKTATHKLLDLMRAKLEEIE